MAKTRGTSTSSFGVSRREGHDASAFYDRFAPPVLSDDSEVKQNDSITESVCFEGTSAEMTQLADNSVALVVTSPPYFVGKDYELAVAGDDGASNVPESYLEFLAMLRTVFAECVRVLEPGGRIAVNVANLGRKPYRSLSADVITILQDELGLLLRGEVIWVKSKTSSGSCAWGSFGKASNPVLRDNTERVIIASKGRFQRARPPAKRAAEELPHRSTLSNDEFIDVTKDVWEIEAESAKRVGHPAPFPVDLPRRLIDLYAYVGDTVVDPFCGSGSTLVAAERSGRIGIGYDLDPTYVALSNERLVEERGRLERIGAAAEANDLSSLSADERRDVYLEAAVETQQKVTDIATSVLTEAGFAVEAKKAGLGTAALRAAGVSFDLRATADDGESWWYVDVPGGFTIARSGLERTEGVWRLLGRLQVLASIEPDARVLVLTPNLPRAGSAAAKAMHSVGSDQLFDAIELFDIEGRHRLEAYAKGAACEPLAGFWPPSAR